MGREEELYPGAGSNYSSVTLDGMALLVTQMTTAGSTLQDRGAALQREAVSLGVSCPAYAQIIEIGVWAEGEVPALQRRLTLAQAMQSPGGSPSATFSLREPLEMTAVEAAAKGEELAQRILESDTSDGAELHEILEELGPYADDPDVASAFFAKLGPEYTEALINNLEHSETGEEDLRAFSEAFAAAMRDPYPSEGFTELTETFTTQTDERYRTWPRLALLQYADFPPEFVADMVAANGLDELLENGLNTSYTDFRNGFGSGWYDLSEDTLALMFGALADNPEAARLVFGRSDVDIAEMTEWAFAIPRSLGTGGDITTAFGEAMNAASGVDDETMGNHSPEAAAMAFEFLVGAANAGETPWELKEALGELMASYAPELVTGAESRDAGTRDSSMSEPPDFSRVPGIDPAFYLSPKDVYELLENVADDDRWTLAFDEAVGGLYNDALHASANATDDQWTVTLDRFGQLAGLQYAAQKKIRGDMDEWDAKMRGYVATALTLGLGKVPTPTGIAAGIAWKAASFGIKKGINHWKTGDPDKTRVAALEDETLQASFVLHYELASVLVHAGHPGAAGIPPELLDGDGELKAPGEIMRDEDLLETYSQWSDGTDDSSTTSLDYMLDYGQSVFQGGHQHAENQATTY